MTECFEKLGVTMSVMGGESVFAEADKGLRVTAVSQREARRLNRSIRVLVTASAAVPLVVTSCAGESTARPGADAPVSNENELVVETIPPPQRFELGIAGQVVVLREQLEDLPTRPDAARDAARLLQQRSGWASDLESATGIRTSQWRLAEGSGGDMLIAFGETGSVAAAAEIVHGADGDVLRAFGTGGLTPADPSLEGDPIVWSDLRIIDERTVEVTAKPTGCRSGARVEGGDVRALVWLTDDGTVLALRERGKPGDGDCQSRPPTVLRIDLNGHPDGELLPEPRVEPEPESAR